MLLEYFDFSTWTIQHVKTYVLIFWLSNLRIFLKPLYKLFDTTVKFLPTLSFLSEILQHFWFHSREKASDKVILWLCGIAPFFSLLYASSTFFITLFKFKLVSSLSVVGFYFIWLFSLNTTSFNEIPLNYLKVRLAFGLLKSFL